MKKTTCCFFFSNSYYLLQKLVSQILHHFVNLVPDYSHSFVESVSTTAIELVLALKALSKVIADGVLFFN